MRILGTCLLTLCLLAAVSPAQVTQYDPHEFDFAFMNDPALEAEFRAHVKTAPDDILTSDCEGVTGWQDAGNGLGGQTRHVVELDGELFTLYFDNGRHLVRYDGQKWHYEAEFDIGGFVVYAMEVFEGELYIGGTFIDVQDMPGTRGIVKWNGSAWESVGGGLFTNLGYASVFSMAVHDGKLHVGGSFTAAGGLSAGNIASWDGERWEALSSGVDNSVMTMVSHQGDLFVGGPFKTAGSKPIPHIAGWRDGEWYALGSSTDRAVTSMASYGDDLYVFGHYISTAGGGEVIRSSIWDGNSWRPAGNGMERFHNIRGWITVGDKMYLSGYVAGDDPSYARLQGVAMFDGTEWTVLGVVKGLAWGVVLLDGALHLSGYFSEICGTEVNNFAVLGNRDVHALVTGSVYSDLNDNCEVDASDHSMARSIIKVEPGPIYTRTRNDGSYSLYLRPGDYTVSSEARPYWEQTCPSGPETYSLSIASADEEHSGLDFGNRAQNYVEALDVSVVGAGRLRPGRTVDYWIRYENVGTLPFNGRLRMHFDSPLAFVVSVPAADRQYPNEVEWDLSDVPVGAVGSIVVTLRLPADEELTGMELCVRVSGQADHPSDEILEDIQDEFCREVTNAVDPNIISVAPGGVGPEGKITPDIKELSYTVQFQNTGTDTAFKVVVVDTLDHNLFDIGSLRIGAASHKFSFELSGSGILTWTFDNIMLPDSNVNEAASHGVLKYKVKLRPGLTVGTAIRNRAGIYFDFNKPVITNTALTTLASEATSVEPPNSDVRIRLYPNPASDLMTIAGSDLAAGEIVLHNTLGQPVGHYSHDGGRTARIKLSDLPAGSYYLSLPTVLGTQVLRVVIVD